MNDLLSTTQEASTPPRRRVGIASLVGLAIAVTMEWHSGVVTGWIVRAIPGTPHTTTQAVLRAIGSQLVWDWAVVAILVAIVLRWEHRPLASIGLKPFERRFVPWVLGAAALGFVLPQLLPARGFVQEGPMQQIFRFPFAFKVVLVLTAAITEEVISRGYMIERLIDLTHRPWVAAAASCALFAGGHIAFFGLRTVLFVQLPGAIILVVVYLRTRNLPAVILVHLIGDLPVLLPASVVHH